MCTYIGTHIFIYCAYIYIYPIVSHSHPVKPTFFMLISPIPMKSQMNSPGCVVHRGRCPGVRHWCSVEAVVAKKVMGYPAVNCPMDVENPWKSMKIHDFHRFQWIPQRKCTISSNFEYRPKETISTSLQCWWQAINGVPWSFGLFGPAISSSNICHKAIRSGNQLHNWKFSMMCWFSRKKWNIHG